MRNPYRVGVRKPKGKRKLGRPRHRRDGNIIMDLNRNILAGCELDSYGSGYGPVSGCCNKATNFRIS
jgi:hypothetical protein